MEFEAKKSERIIADGLGSKPSKHRGTPNCSQVAPSDSASAHDEIAATTSSTNRIVRKHRNSNHAPAAENLLTNFPKAMKLKHRTLPFDLRSLEIFLAVCETGGMAAAASELGLTQPAVSQTISELEKRTGTDLFDRKCRPLALTLSGSLMRQRATALLSDAHQISPLLQDAKQGKVSFIRVGLVDSLNRALTIKLSEYLQSRAGKVAILSGLTAAHASELLTRKLDLFLGVDDLEETAGLERWEIGREPYVLLLPAGTRMVQTIDDLKRLAETKPFIRFSARSQTGVEIERHLRRLGIVAAQSFEYDSPYSVAAMVSAGQGFAISTALCVSESQLGSDGLITCPLPGPIVSRKLSVVARFRELGQIPRDVADVTRIALGEHICALNI